jgi:hypothetical protein
MPGSSLTYAIADPVAPYNFASIPPSSFDAVNDTINLGVAHNFATGDVVTLGSFGTSTLSGNITSYIKYFVIVVNTTTIKLATTYTNAVNGIALDISVPSANGNFSKTNEYASFCFPEHYSAYAKSSSILNSSIPVQIDFTVPAYTIPAGVTLGNFKSVAVFLRQVGTNKCWGLTGRDESFSRIWMEGCDGTTGGSLGLPVRTYVAISTGINTTTTGYKQRYVITSQRRIECWLWSAASNTPVLVYTTTALDANVSLQLDFGSNFSWAKITDCTIKAL